MLTASLSYSVSGVSSSVPVEEEGMVVARIKLFWRRRRWLVRTYRRHVVIIVPVSNEIMSTKYRQGNPVLFSLAKGPVLIRRVARINI